MDDQQGLDYRNLMNCRIEIASSSGSAPQSSVRLPQECYNAANLSLPPVYDFALEKSILQKHNNGGGATSSTEEEDATLAEMKSVTNANDQVCVSILQNNHYDLKTSIEAYFQSPSGSTATKHISSYASSMYKS